MNKPGSARAALEKAIPSLVDEPDKLTVFIDSGSIAATGGHTVSFEYRYTLNLLLLDFGGEADDVMIALVEWARANQPDLVTNWDQRETGITFECDVLNNATVDLSIKMKLSESIAVTTAADGSRTVQHVDDSLDTWVAPA
ncbi:tail completion protein R (GpR) [Paraburkholderia unamae]|uniref:phage tail protein n=1 Tax=Paraburkholderia unamae TaxID=219649 RepID=UPI000DC40A66|nr:phage tail protein [Paraburkholderia unamae]RAR53893.1 tail completion protein R (GpR) [Paraburkholderia unamae]